jgi:hypothetical protein
VSSTLAEIHCARRKAAMTEALRAEIARRAATERAEADLIADLARTNDGRAMAEQIREAM